LRFLPGKTCLIIDHSTTVRDLGWPDDCYDEMTALGLNDEARKAARKRKAKKKLDLAPECPSCGYARRPGENKCPQCNFEPKRQSKIEFADGELAEVTRAGARKESRKYTRADKQSWWSQLLSIAYERKYEGLSGQELAKKRLGWANAKYKSKFGVWPRGVDNVLAEPTREVRNWVISDNIRYSKSMKRKAA
jgi:hypothetical protein